MDGGCITAYWLLMAVSVARSDFVNADIVTLGWTLRKRSSVRIPQLKNIDNVSRMLTSIQTSDCLFTLLMAWSWYPFHIRKDRNNDSSFLSKMIMIVSNCFAVINTCNIVSLPKKSRISAWKVFHEANIGRASQCLPTHNVHCKVIHCQFECPFKLYLQSNIFSFLLIYQSKNATFQYIYIHIYIYEEVINIRSMALTLTSLMCVVTDNQNQIQTRSE